MFMSLMPAHLSVCTPAWPQQDLQSPWVLAEQPSLRDLSGLCKLTLCSVCWLKSTGVDITGLVLRQGQAQDHVPLKTQWLKLPQKDWMHLRSHLCPKNVRWIYTKDFFESQLVPRFAHLFCIGGFRSSGFCSVQQRIHSQVSLQCACNVHRVSCTSSTLKCAGFFLKCSHLSWNAWAEPPTH